MRKEGAFGVLFGMKSLFVPALRSKVQNFLIFVKFYLEMILTFL